MHAAASAAPANRLSTLPEGEPKFTLGWEAIRWAEQMLVQPNGPRTGLSFRFTRDQMRFVLWWYAMDRDGRWLYYHGARRNAKGTGKSPFAAVLALIEFCGPVRLERKDARLPGGCQGRPVELPLVQIAATAESQTANTMRMVRAFANKDSELVYEYGLDPGKTRYYRVPEGTLEVITASPTASEGAEASFIVADETEHWKPANSGPEFMEVLSDNLAKSGSRLLETSNAWVPGEASVAESTWDAWVAQEEGRLRGKAKILYDARVAPPETDLADEASLRRALEWVYGDCDWRRAGNGRLNTKPLIERIWSPLAKPSESKRKYLNWPTAPEESWTTPELVAQLVKARPVADDEPVVLFFDGSRTRDATALVACCVSDGHVFVPTWANGRPTIWEPSPAHDADDVVPVEQVDMAVDEVLGRYSKVLGFWADVNEWESFVKVEWPKRYAARLTVKASGTSHNVEPIAWDMRNHTVEFTRAAELTAGEIDQRLFTYDGNPILTRHLHNARNRINRYGITIGKDSPASPKKIDAAVCLIGARMIRRVALGVPAAPAAFTPRRIR